MSEVAAIHSNTDTRFVALAKALLEGFPGRRSAFAARAADGQWHPLRDDQRIDRALTLAEMEDHVRGTKRLGMYLFDPSENQTKVRCAVLDLDDHDGCAGWEQTVTAGQELGAELTRRGIKFSWFRSSGGAGMHIWLMFSQPIDAKMVRGFLADTVQATGRHCGSEGGIAAGVVEVFPKQDRVKPENYGNLVAFPLAGNSVPLDSTGNPLSTESFLEFLHAIEPNDPEVVLRHLPARRAPGRPRNGRELVGHPLDACEFISHCRNSAASLREPLWYAAATNCATVEGGAALFHELSRADTARYDSDEVDRKLEHARQAPGPHSCQTIAAEGFRCPRMEECGKCAIHGGTRPADFALDAKARIEQIRRGRLVAPVRDREIAKVVLSDLRLCGRLLKTRNPTRLMYFDDGERALYEIEGGEFSALCDEKYDLNASTTTWRYVREDLKAKCERGGEQAKVFRAFVYKDTDKKLYIDAGANQMIRLDGERVDMLPNGSDGILFERSNMEDIPLEALSLSERRAGSNGSTIRKLLVDPLNTSNEYERDLFHAYIYTLFFESLLPSKPIVLLSGEKGSGKTSAARALKRALFGREADVSTGFTKGESDATTAIVNNYLLVADNVDGMVKWMQNLLASVSTGTEISHRALYTNNEEIKMRPRCFLMITSRDPVSLKRDDIADRLLVINLERPSIFLTEADRLRNIAVSRAEIWAELLQGLNQVIQHLATGNLPTTSDHRLADWARMATLVGDVLDVGDVEGALRQLSAARHEFMLEGNAIFEGIERWVDLGRWEVQGKSGMARWITTGDLFREVKSSMYQCGPGGLSTTAFPITSAQYFGREIMHNMEALQRYFKISTKPGSARSKLIQIAPKETDMASRNGETDAADRKCLVIQ